jgi:hypothetical protein
MSLKNIVYQITIKCNKKVLWAQSALVLKEEGLSEFR